MMSELDGFIFANFLTANTSAPRDNRQNVLALRAARATGCEAEVITMILNKRRANLIQATLWQRKWGTNVSRRPQRGNHHDSWAQREAYVRADGSRYSDHLAYAHEIQARFSTPTPIGGAA